MEIWIIALLLFLSLLTFLLLGVHVAFALGGISILFGLIFWNGLPSLDGFVLGTYERTTQAILTALPLYIFMAAVLMYSDLADDMYEAIYRWFGGVKGGLAAGTSIVAAVFASMVGVASVATAAVGMVARPSMLKRKYDDQLTLGVIMAGGVLGALIPPSIVMIVYAAEASVSAGALFMAGIVPGIMACLLFIVYSLILCYFRPEKGPSVEVDMRYTLREKFQSLKSIVLPGLVILLALGSIYLGVATPTEAGAVGAVGAVFAAGVRKKLTFVNIKQIFMMTAKLCGIVFWILIGAVAYARIVTVTGTGEWLGSMITDAGLNRWVVLILILLFFLVLGMFIDTVAVLLITAPLFLPVLGAFDFNMVWFGILFTIAVCIGNLTPPFGISIFIMKGVAPDIRTSTLYRAVWPFVFILLFCMILVLLFPEIAMFVPTQMLGQ
ncbi:TRAP transporter large permease [Geomicrobium sediminis]|uniref:Tripartite ATP-independent transporter DctM subunit n=1 Tax=Geomicrobium sediminis TaxID=1347788 RepID=A0ABS2P777_9BACL|nr:TRAP transporter large permease subunit [Geomicrobium sediminis]MBM7631154.1 tripartite ATP-independent transporter DctM subunit [Geomicrobium sediminis]